MKPIPDETLLRAWADHGDVDALDALVSRHWTSVERTAREVLGEPAAAEDAAQETFIKVACCAERFADGRAFGPWLRTIARNTARDAARMRGRRAVHESAAALRRRDLVARDALPDAEAPAALADARAALPGHLGGLSDKLREAIELRYFRGMSLRQVAAVAGCSVPTATSRIRRGTQRLRESLARAGIAVGLALALLGATLALLAWLAAKERCPGVAPEGERTICSAGCHEAPAAPPPASPTTPGPGAPVTLEVARWIAPAATCCGDCAADADQTIRMSETSGSGESSPARSPAMSAATSSPSACGSASSLRPNPPIATRRGAPGTGPTTGSPSQEWPQTVTHSRACSAASTIGPSHSRASFSSAPPILGLGEAPTRPTSPWGSIQRSPLISSASDPAPPAPSGGRTQRSMPWLVDPAAPRAGAGPRST